MGIQIFGTTKCFDTKKAVRFFQERRVAVQNIDLKEKGISRGELESVISLVQKVAGSREAAIEELINPKAKDYASIVYLDDADKFEKLLENPLLLRTPIVRNGKTAATVGYQANIWKTWE